MWGKSNLIFKKKKHAIGKPEDLNEKAGHSGQVPFIWLPGHELDGI